MNTQLLQFRERVMKTSEASNHKVDRQTRKLLVCLFTGTRGGITRLRITMMLLERPYNTHQLAQELGIDYKGIQHHLRVMEKNNLISKVGKRYGMTYHISSFLEFNIFALIEAIDKLERKMNSKKVYM